MRHNCVLKILKQHLLNFWSRLIPDDSTFDQGVNLPFINFINESGSSNYVTNTNKKSRTQKTVALLSRADDWTCLFDEEDNLVFPSEIVITVQRPDIVIYSSSIKRVIIIELTVPKLTEDCCMCMSMCVCLNVCM